MDDEIILRASYNPMHYNGERLKPSFVRPAHLFDGQLSVWRASSVTGISVSDAASILRNVQPSGNSLRALHGARVRDIRRAVAEDGNRFFCVLDETETDDHGGSHPAHAHIALCEKFKALLTDQNDLRFKAAKEQLVLILRQPELQFAA